MNFNFASNLKKKLFSKQLGLFEYGLGIGRWMVLDTFYKNTSGVINHTVVVYKNALV